MNAEGPGHHRYGSGPSFSAGRYIGSHLLRVYLRLAESTFKLYGILEILRIPIHWRSFMSLEVSNSRSTATPFLSGTKTRRQPYRFPWTSLGKVGVPADSC